MTAFVLDCSVTMAWCFEDESDAYADGVLSALADHQALVPSLWLLEVVNVLLLAERKKRLHSADTTRFLGSLQALPIVVEELGLPGAFQEITAVARESGLTAYDGAYLIALAMRTGLPLATRDRALRSACRKAGVALFRS